MDKKKTRKIVVSILVPLVLVLLATMPCAYAIGLGVSPPEITVHNALREGQYNQTAMVFNTANESAEFEFKATGEMKDWILFYDEGKQVSKTIVPGKGSKKITIGFKIPTDAENRAYKSTIYVQTVPQEITNVTGAVASAVVRMPIAASVEVTGTQIIKGFVKTITTRDIEVGYPLRIKIDFENAGNVIATPVINVDISKEGEMVDSFSYSDTKVNPGSKELILAGWNTTGREIGEYNATVNVLLGGESLAEKELQFKILAVGTLTRQGVFSDFKYTGEPLVNRVIKIIAEFENIGEIDATAKFMGEIYTDGNLIDTIDSEELLVPVGDKETLTSYFKIESPGDYTIKGHVLYGMKKTDTKELSFVAPVPEEQSPSGFEISLALIVLALIAVSLAILMLWRMRKKGRE